MKKRDRKLSIFILILVIYLIYRLVIQIDGKEKLIIMKNAKNKNIYLKKWLGSLFIKETI